jgi:hypothetical protein
MNTLSSLLNFIGSKIPKIGVYEFTASSVSSLPYTNNSATGITADHVVVASELSNSSAKTGDWTVTTGAGTFTITGTISGTTDIKLRFGTKVN